MVRLNYTPEKRVEEKEGLARKSFLIRSLNVKMESGLAKIPRRIAID